MKSIKKSSVALSLLFFSLPLSAMEQTENQDLKREDLKEQNPGEEKKLGVGDPLVKVWGNSVLGGESVEKAAEAFLASDEYLKLKSKADKWAGRLQVLFREQSKPDSVSYKLLLKHAKKPREMKLVAAVAVGGRCCGKVGRLASLLATSILGLEAMVLSDDLRRANQATIQPEAGQEKGA